MTASETAVRERPILFSGEMVRAILDGRKTQTRRVVKPQPPQPIPAGIGVRWAWWPSRERFVPSGTLAGMTAEMRSGIACPYGHVGDVLWVREAFTIHDGDFGSVLAYRADNSTVLVGRTEEEGDHICGDADWWKPDDETIWRPSIHMPRWACRLRLEIAAMRVQQLQEITISDCADEAAPPTHEADNVWDSTETFRDLWDKINGHRKPDVSWESNPWVWAVTFKRI